MWEWARPYSIWLYVALSLACGALIVAARRLAISPRLKRWWLFVPRGLVFGLLLLILLNPVRRDELPLPAEPSTVLYLVDCSQSMGLDSGVNRLEQVKQLIHGAAQLASGPDAPRVQLYRFGRQLSAAADLAGLQATEDASRLQEALERLPGRFARRLPQAVVVFSDGAVEQPFAAAELASYYKRLGVPLHVVPVGDPRVRGDVAVQELVVPRQADEGTTVQLHGLLRSRGFDGERVVVQVRHADAALGDPLVRLPLTLSAGEQPVELALEASAEHGDLVFEVTPLDGEALADNNRVPFELAVGSRKIKVLYMEGTGSNEYHWVHDALTEDKDIECESLVLDNQYVQRPRLMRVRDPYKGFPATREELLAYDCVICSDISRGAFTPEQLDWTVELVARRGGGFAMVGGHTSFGAGFWDQTVWDQLIPIDMSGGTLGRGWVYHNFRLRIPAELETHPIWRIVPDPEQNRQALAEMPAFLGTNYVERVKPAATVLAFSAVEIPQAGVMPVLASESYGRGRTLALASDTTADWGRDFERLWGVADNRYFRKFWRNAVRWLSANSAGAHRRLQCDTDRVIYRPDQPVQLTARLYDDELRETVAYQLHARLVCAEQPASAGSAQSISPAADGRSYQGQLAFPPANSTGDATIRPGLVPWLVELVASDGGGEVARTTLRVQLLNDSQELLDPQPMPARLRELAAASGGQSMEQAAQLASLLRNAPQEPAEIVVTRTPLWDRSALWLLLIALLGTEWSLRRRGGYD